MENLLVTTGQAFTLSIHTYNGEATPPTPQAIDSAAMPTIQVLQGGVDVSSNWTINANPNGNNPNADTGMSVANRYDLSLTCNSGAGIFQVVVGAQVNSNLGSATIASVQVGLVQATLSDVEHLAIAARTLDTLFLSQGTQKPSFATVTGSAIVYGDRASFLATPGTLTALDCNARF